MLLFLLMAVAKIMYEIVDTSGSQKVTIKFEPCRYSSEELQKNVRSR